MESLELATRNLSLLVESPLLPTNQDADGVRRGRPLIIWRLLRKETFVTSWVVVAGMQVELHKAGLEVELHKAGTMGLN